MTPVFRAVFDRSRSSWEDVVQGTIHDQGRARVGPGSGQGRAIL